MTRRLFGTTSVYSQWKPPRGVAVLPLKQLTAAADPRIIGGRDSVEAVGMHPADQFLRVDEGVVDPIDRCSDLL